MSIFKIKEWWSNKKLQNEESCVGIQNTNCLKVDRFNCHSDSDCLLIGEDCFLKIYKPNADQETTHTLLEAELPDFILEIQVGKFVSGYDDRQILLLHPRSYSIYQLKKKDGHTDAGDQNQLLPMIKHSFTRKADSVTCGPFGNIKTRDFICIQGLDGSLSFFDQNTFLFMCIFNDIIIPGPISYVSNCDSFIICKSTWIMEIYSYQQLREFSELTTNRQNKMNIPQWTYNAGEEVTQIQIIQTSSNFSSIIALGERHLYCFQDNGLMKYLIRFDYMPVCFNAYLIGWYYEPTAKLLVMVASEDSKLFVYEGTTLLWSCDLLATPISITRCFLKTLSGGVVTLSGNGIVHICYLGTEPDLNGNVTPMANEVVDPEQLQQELETVEGALRNILGNNEDNNWSHIEKILKIKVDIGKPVQNIFPESTTIKEAIHLLMCPVIVIISCDDPKQVQSVQITYVCCQPFECSESTICLDGVNGTEIVETQVFLSNDFDISETRIKILFTVTDAAGKIVMMETKVLLPLSLYCSVVEEPNEKKLKIIVEGSQPCIEFSKIFTDFTEEDLFKYEGASCIKFGYRTSKTTIILKQSSNQYTIEADEFTDFPAILEYFLYRLTNHYTRMGVNDFRYRLIYEKDLVKQVIVKFLRGIETHAKERIKLKTYEDELNVLQRQFIVIQKRLLVQYGSLPPGICDPLDFLMKDTHQRLIQCANNIIINKENVCRNCLIEFNVLKHLQCFYIPDLFPRLSPDRAGNTVTVIGHLIITLLKRVTNDDFKVKLIEEMLTLTSLYEHYQEWEEAVAQALTYILNNVIQKSEKDKEKLAPVQDQAILSQINLKRFSKQLRIVIDKMFNDSYVEKQDKQQITRIEELVEVL